MCKLKLHANSTGELQVNADKVQVRVKLHMIRYVR